MKTAIKLSTRIPVEYKPHMTRCMEEHRSQLISPSQVADPNTTLFLVTQTHLTWLKEAVPEALLDEAVKAGRVRLIDSEGEIADPFFGDQEDYNLALEHILATLPISLTKVLKEIGALPVLQEGEGTIGKDLVELFARSAALGREAGLRQARRREANE